MQLKTDPDAQENPRIEGVAMATSDLQDIVKTEPETLEEESLGGTAATAAQLLAPGKKENAVVQKEVKEEDVSSNGEDISGTAKANGSKKRKLVKEEMVKWEDDDVKPDVKRVKVEEISEDENDEFRVPSLAQYGYGGGSHDSASLPTTKTPLQEPSPAIRPPGVPIMHTTTGVGPTKHTMGLVGMGSNSTVNTGRSRLESSEKMDWSHKDDEDSKEDSGDEWSPPEGLAAGETTPIEGSIASRTRRRMFVDEKKPKVEVKKEIKVEVTTEVDSHDEWPEIDLPAASAPSTKWQKNGRHFA